MGDDENDVEIVGDVESVPEPDCDMDRVPQGDAVYETDTVPHTLADDDGDDIGEPDALSDQLLELVPHDVYELDSVDEIVGDVESVPDTDEVRHKLAEAEDDAPPVAEVVALLAAE